MSLSTDPFADPAAQPAPAVAPQGAPQRAEGAPTDPDAPWENLPIELRNVSHSFGPVVAIDNISLSVRQGTLLA